MVSIRNNLFYRAASKAETPKWLEQRQATVCLLEQMSFVSQVSRRLGPGFSLFGTHDMSRDPNRLHHASYAMASRPSQGRVFNT